MSTPFETRAPQLCATRDSWRSLQRRSSRASQPSQRGRTWRFFGLATALLACAYVTPITTAAAHKTDPSYGAICDVRRLVFEPDEANATAIQIHGVCSLFKGEPMPGQLYTDPKPGYLYLACQPGQEKACRDAWATVRTTLCSAACTGVGAEFTAAGTLRPPDSTPSAPDPFTMGAVPVVGVGTHLGRSDNCPDLKSYRIVGADGGIRDDCPVRDGGVAEDASGIEGGAVSTTCSDDMLSTKTPDGRTFSCVPYKCRASDGQCATSCGAAAHCAPGFDCNGVDFTCTRGTGGTDGGVNDSGGGAGGGGKGGCATAASGTSGASGLLGGALSLAVALVCEARRRRRGPRERVRRG